MTRFLRCPECGAFHNGDEKECVLCYRPDPYIEAFSVPAYMALFESQRKIRDGHVDRLIVDGQVFERDHRRISMAWTTRGRGRHEHLEGIGEDLRKANIDLLHKICVFEMRELLGCHEGPKSLTDWNLRHRKSRGVNLEDWIDDEKEKEGQ